ncbi:MAG TPA: DUF6044 family protein [Methylomirabilota bacterium]|nr:DUF6044 family protein [Methylomirabilota bacterium]
MTANKTPQVGFGHAHRDTVEIPAQAPLSRLYVWTMCVTAGWLSLEYLALGPYSWMYGYGGALETIPVYLALAKTGSAFSLWAPFLAGGLDRLSFWGSADALNLEPLFFATFPVWLAYGLLQFLQRAAVVYFTARVCDEQLGMSPRASALAGLLHAGVTYFSLGESVAISALPLLLWALPKIANLRWFLLWAVIGGLGFSTLTTFSQSFPFLIAFAMLWFLFIVRERSARFFLAAFAFAVAVGVMDSPQLLAMLYNAPFSHRVGWPVESLDWSFRSLFYYGLHFDFFHQDKIVKTVLFNLPLILVALGSIVAWRYRREWAPCRLFLAIAALYVLLSLKVIFVGAQRIAGLIFPWVHGINMERFYTIPAPFLMTVTMAIALFVILPKVPVISRWRAAYGGIVGAFILFLLFWPKVSLFYPLMIDSWGEGNFKVRALHELRQSESGLFRVASVLDLQPAYAYAHGLEAADGWANLFPRVYQELWLRVLDPLFENLPKNRDIFDPPKGRPQDHYIFLGTGLLTPGIGLLPGENPTKALEEGFDIDRRFNLHLLSLLNVKYLLSEYPLKANGLRSVHEPIPPPSALRSRDYATGLVNSPRQRQKGDPRWRQIFTDLREAIERKRRGKDIYIYENVQVLPRYRFVTQIRTAETGREVLNELSRMTSNALRETALVEERDTGQLGNVTLLSAGAVEIERYAPDEIRLSIQNSHSGFLVIANTWNPSWRAEVDGHERSLVRTNHAQFGLPTKPNEQRVRLYYAPPYGPVRLLLAHRRDG